ncbi:L-lactate dehydrogenase [Actinotignum sanguinis]|uniref:L-lactate dehydrogenase n=1 Tax=Actinotignum sanguinis TaxID=1445614 RepID=UPI000F7E2965|nr:L-lactate dehydrogenase [Actinotignum sanguinis]MDY5148274.1 L-lactate dehydrogenase [Actinotignum sanguinis]RTE47715.1 L-lactate dehydrogenase [Actinotignum sanguinis]
MIDQRTEGSKVSIIGAGAVGTSLAYAMLIKGVARHVVLQDINAQKVHAEALDLMHGGQFMPTAKIEGTDNVEATADSDVIVITAGARQRPGQSRLDLAGASVAMMRSIVPPLVELSPNAIFVVVANPVDVVTQAVLKISGLPPARVFGTGTVLDSSRLRQLISQKFLVATSNVHAYMCGEHGDSETPMWSMASISTVPIREWELRSGPVTDELLDGIADRVINAAYEVIEGKGSTNYAIGLAASRIIQAVLRDERVVLSVSRLMTGWNGISGVCMSVPTIVGARGAIRQIDMKPSDAELESLRASAAQIREALSNLEGMGDDA